MHKRTALWRTCALVAKKPYAFGSVFSTCRHRAVRKEAAKHSACARPAYMFDQTEQILLPSLGHNINEDGEKGRKNKRETNQTKKSRRHLPRFDQSCKNGHVSFCPSGRNAQDPSQRRPVTAELCSQAVSQPLQLSGTIKNQHSFTDKRLPP